MSGSLPRISVVTPFYNTAEYLAECIESVLGQTYGDFEYLLVNNRSTDGSREIAARYAAQDSRIRLIDNEAFLPQLANYNLALARIADDTRWVKIVQADDWAYRHCLEEMLRLAESKPNIAGVSAYTKIGRRVYLQGLLDDERVLSGREICRRFLLHGTYVFGSQTAHMMNADLVRARRPFYYENSPCPDVDFWFEILPGRDFAFVPQVLTFTRRQNESVMSKLRNFDIGQVSEMVCMMKYGSAFLDPAELASRRERVLDDYYDAMAERWMRRAPPAYWDFQSAARAHAGLGFSRTRLMRAVGRGVLDLALNPKSTLEGVARVLERRRQPVAERDFVAAQPLAPDRAGHD